MGATKAAIQAQDEREERAQRYAMDMLQTLKGMTTCARLECHLCREAAQQMIAIVEGRK